MTNKYKERQVNIRVKLRQVEIIINNGIREVGENNVKADNTNYWKEDGEREFIYCLYKLVQLPMVTPRKLENVYSTLIKFLGISFRPREIIVPLAKG